MALNYPGPYQLRIFYTADATPGGDLAHRMAFNIDCDPAPDPGDLFPDITVKLLGGGTNDLDTLVSAFIVECKPFFHATDSIFTHAELWKVEEDTFNMTYLTSRTLAVSPTGATAIIPASQMIYTFRSIEGGIMRVDFLDTIVVPSVKLTYAAMTADQKDIVDMILSPAGGFFLARDTSFPLICLGLFIGQSEAVFKKRYRQ